jgi:predicted phosphodiesterase
MPKVATDLNGVVWPPACFGEGERLGGEYHFFVIGDWGGFWGREGPRPWPNEGRKRVAGIDDHAQLLVAARMQEVAKTSRPQFIINAGDNFYPGGIEGHCDGHSGTRAFKSFQFANIFERVYTGDGLDGKEWWGVMGNHDFGGFKYNNAWDQNIYYTWHSPHSRWITPALYWSRRAVFPGFSVDFFFYDSNSNDAGPSNLNEDHNICSYTHNEKDGHLDCNIEGLTSPDACTQWFRDLFHRSSAWLEDKLAHSDADWQIIVTHYPANYEPTMSDVFLRLIGTYGVDLIISGHVHRQEIHYREGSIFGDTAWIVSGGGGGIGSESPPSVDGMDDQYGFMDLTISKDKIYVVAHSHGGFEGRTIIRNTSTIYPRPRR